MRISTLAAHGALILLAVGPAAAAQDGTRAYVEAMNEATRKRMVKPVRPGDQDLNCARIRIELAQLDRVLAGDAGAVRAKADAEDMAKPAEQAEREEMLRARDAANAAAPMGMSPGRLIEEPYRAKVAARQALRQHDYLLLAMKSGKDFNFIAARIPYLHALAEERCTPEELAGIAQDAAATSGPPTPPPAKSKSRVYVRR